MCGNADGFHWVRVLARTVRQVSETHYEVRIEAVHACPAEVGASCGDGEYPPTPSDTYHPTHNPDVSTAVLYYSSPGFATPEVPTPGWDGGSPFPDLGTGTNPDYIGDCFDAFVRVMVVGAGTLDVRTSTYGGSPRGIQAYLFHRHPGDPNATLDDTQLGTTGDTFTFEVSTHDGMECIHWVDIGDDGNVCGGKWGFAGATWVSAEI